MGLAESNVIKKRLSSLKSAERLFRINSGMGWAGRSTKITKPTTLRLNPGDVVIKNGQPFHGAPEGFPDLAGWESITVTPEMVGQTVAVFKGVEAKTIAYKRLSKAQESFSKLLKSMGGVFEVVREE